MVTGGDIKTVRIGVGTRPGDPARGILTVAGRVFHCALGRTGITRFKREGDGATPAGRFRLLSVFYRVDRVVRPRTLLPVSAIQPDDGWCDDPGDRNYNRPVGIPYSASAETLWREDCLYDIVVVLDHNISTRRRGAGSAIFFHVAKPGYPPTEGCVAVAADDMRRILDAAGPDAAMVIG